MPSRLRVLCFIHAPDLGGVERAALRLCTAWSRGDADIALLIGRGDCGRRAGATRLIAPPAFPISPAAFETLWMIWWLWHVVRRERPDALFCPGNSYTIVAVAMRLLLGSACPPILAKLSNDLGRTDMPPLLRVFYHLWCRIQGGLIRQFIAFTPAMQAEACRLLGVPERRVAVIGNATLDDAELDRLANAGEMARATRGNGRRFVAAGRLEPQKNHALMIAAFARGNMPGDMLAIFGEGSLRPQLERQIAAHDLGESVSLPGAAEHAAQWLGEADVFLLSSDYEGLPAVVTEALAAGVTVIATACCASLPALLGAVGTIVPLGDVDALAATIAAADPDAVDRTKAQARAKLHTTAATAAAYLQLLAVLSTRASPLRIESRA